MNVKLLLGKGGLSVSPHPFISCISSPLCSQAGPGDRRVMRPSDQAYIFRQCFDFKAEFSL